MKTLLILSAILLAIPTFAQEQPKENDAEMVDLMFVNYKNRLDVLKAQDNLLKSLLNIPFDKRVYVYPALFESHNIPKKIVTHPQIIIWKGKKPTKIAPQMQKFAQEHLDYMPAKFYPLLDPDAWPKVPKESDWQSVGELLGDTIVTPNDATRQALLNDTK